MLAEADGLEWYDLGFDMTYGWSLYGFGKGILRQIADGTNHANHFGRYAAQEVATYAGKYRMYFTSNHDENSWYGTPAELFGEAEEVFTVLTAPFNGMPLIYGGQEAALEKRLAFFEKDFIVEHDHKNMALYELLQLKRRNRAL